MAVWSPRHGLLAPLSTRTYRHLFYAQLLSLLGSGLATVALALLAYELAGDQAGPVLGMALAIKMVAYVGVSPFASAIAGHFSRRTFLVSLDVVRAAVVLVLPFVDQVWQVYVLVFVLQSASAAFTPVFRATIPDILPDQQDFSKAMSLSRIAYETEQLLSPSIAAALLTVISFHWLFVGTTLGFLASAALVISVILPVDRRLPLDDDGFADRLSRGLRIYLKTPRLRGLLAVNCAVAAAGAMVLVNTVVLVRKGYGGDAGDVALMMAVAGCGSIAMAMALPSLLQRASARTVMISGAGGLALFLALGMVSDSLVHFAILWLLLGIASSAAQTPTEILLSRSAASDDRPRLYAAQFALSHACWLITYPAAGWLGVTIGLPYTFIVLACLAGLGVLIAMAIWPQDDPAELPHIHGAVEHTHWHVHDEHHQHTHSDWDGKEPHFHPHAHDKTSHSHVFVIDRHHKHWPHQYKGI